MKKILAMLLVLVMALGLASSALAVSWAAPAISSAASPFAAEVIKLGINGDITGAKYYTVLTDAAAYNYSNIYFAVRVTVPSFSNANAYYGNSGFLSGNKVKVTVNYTNLDAKGEGTYYIPLTDSSQTLWLNTKTSTFDPSWVSSINNNCGCGDSHIISGIAKGAQGASVKVCVGASGELKDIMIDGCYKVEEKDYYGIVPCYNCAVTNLKGFLFSGNCAANGVFFSTNSAGKVTGAYVVDGWGSKTSYLGALVNFDKELYGWFPNGTMTTCAGSCGIVTFVKRQLPVGAKITDINNWKTWANSYAISGLSLGETETRFNAWRSLPEVNKNSDNFNTVYYKNDNNDIVPVNQWSDIAPSGLSTQPGVALSGTEYGKVWWSQNYISGITTDSKLAVTAKVDVSSVLGTGTDKTVYEAYPYNQTGATKNISYGNTWYVKSATSDARLYRQTSANTVNCDFNDASYLNTLNHLYALLGFTYADMTAGNVYMTKDILLTNFGFNTSVCDTKTWSPYTAAITVTPIAEVPATGSMSYLGIAALALAVSTAIIAKKKVRG